MPTWINMEMKLFACTNNGLNGRTAILWSESKWVFHNDTTRCMNQTVSVTTAGWNFSSQQTSNLRTADSDGVPKNFAPLKRYLLHSERKRSLWNVTHNRSPNLQNPFVPPLQKGPSSGKWSALWADGAQALLQQRCRWWWRGWGWGDDGDVSWASKQDPSQWKQWSGLPKVLEEKWNLWWHTHIKELQQEFTCNSVSVSTEEK